MGRNDSSDDVVGLVFVGVLIVFGGVIVWLMRTFDVPWDVAIDTAPGLFTWIIAVAAWCFINFKMDTGFTRWGIPVATAFLVPTFSPILKYSAGVRETGGLMFNDMVSWYGTGWGLTLLFFGVFAAFFAVVYWFNQRF
ncbi:hypothetical protein ACEWWX_000406 [Salmonella enterica]